MKFEQFPSTPPERRPEDGQGDTPDNVDDLFEGEGGYMPAGEDALEEQNVTYEFVQPITVDAEAFRAKVEDMPEGPRHEMEAIAAVLQESNVPEMLEELDRRSPVPTGEGIGEKDTGTLEKEKGGVAAMIDRFPKVRRVINAALLGTVLAGPVSGMASGSAEAFSSKDLRQATQVIRAGEDFNRAFGGHEARALAQKHALEMAVQKHEREAAEMELEAKNKERRAQFEVLEIREVERGTSEEVLGAKRKAFEARLEAERVRFEAGWDKRGFSLKSRQMNQLEGLRKQSARQGARAVRSILGVFK